MLMNNKNRFSVTLATGVTQYKGLARTRELLKLRARSLVFRTATIKWISFLNCAGFYSDLARTNPYLIRKIYRRYLSNTLDCMERVGVLMGHYSFIRRLGWGPMVLQAARTPISLALFEGKSGLPYRLVLQTGLPMEREGDLVLRLLRADEPVCSCAFSFLQTDTLDVAIGGLQGPAHNGLAVMRDTTKDMFGLRPKHFMIKLLAALGHHLGCGKIYLVSNANHAAVRPRREGKVHADYDRLWTECGAVLRTDGNFELPCAPLRPPTLADLPSKKRASAVHRYEHTQTIISMVIGRLLEESRRFRPPETTDFLAHLGGATPPSPTCPGITRPPA